MATVTHKTWNTSQKLKYHFFFLSFFFLPLQSKYLPHVQSQDLIGEVTSFTQGLEMSYLKQGTDFTEAHLGGGGIKLVKYRHEHRLRETELRSWTTEDRNRVISSFLPSQFFMHGGRLFAAFVDEQYNTSVLFSTHNISSSPDSFHLLFSQNNFPQNFFSL